MSTETPKTELRKLWHDYCQETKVWECKPQDDWWGFKWAQYVLQHAAAVPQQSAEPSDEPQYAHCDICLKPVCDHVFATIQRLNLASRPSTNSKEETW